MALVIPPDFFQVLLPFKNEFVLRPAAITFGVEDQDDSRTPQDLADDILAEFQSSFASRIDPSVTVGPASVFFYTTGGEGGSVDGGTSFVGTRSSNNSIPPQIAAIIRKRSNRPGRAGRGRMFMPWCLDRDDVQEDGAVDAGEVTALQTASEGFLDGLTGIQAPMVLLHSDEISGVTSPTYVTALSVDSQSGTQRRRNRK